jgi:hypothetical protein
MNENLRKLLIVDAQLTKTRAMAVDGRYIDNGLLISMSLGPPTGSLPEETTPEAGDDPIDGILVFPESAELILNPLISALEYAKAYWLDRARAELIELQSTLASYQP